MEIVNRKMNDKNVENVEKSGECGKKVKRKKEKEIFRQCVSTSH